MILVPSVLTADPLWARRILEQIRESKKYEKVQVDFIDGEYANNKTIGPDDIDLTPFLIMDFEAHLMVKEENLERYVDRAIKTGFDEVIVQVESVTNKVEYKGLAIDLKTPVDAVKTYLPKLEIVTVLAVKAGWGGQKFDEKVWGKIKTLSDLRKQNKFEYRIQVDGGVQKEHLEKLESMGVDEAVVGADRLLQMVSY